MEFEEQLRAPKPAARFQKPKDNQGEMQKFIVANKI